MGGDGSEAVTQMPPIFPLPFASDTAFATDKSTWFGWNAKTFQVIHNSLVRTKVLHEFPLTDQGWNDAWHTLVAHFPGLADKVSARVSAVRSTREEAAKIASARDELERSVVAEVTDCQVLGGYGWHEPLVVPGLDCTLSFTAEELWVRRPKEFVPLLRRSYRSAVALEFSGPGVQRQGGRFIGGGFGVVGAAEGMIAASMLSALTKRTAIHTVIRYQEPEMEAFFFCSSATPETLRIRLSQVSGTIHAGTKEASMGVADELEKLGRLHKQGLLSDGEFAAMKQKLVERL